MFRPKDTYSNFCANYYAEYCSSRYLLHDQSQQWRNENMWNLSKINNEETRMTSVTSFWCHYCQLWPDLTHNSSVSIVDLEQVNVSWDANYVQQWRHQDIVNWLFFMTSRPTLNTNGSFSSTIESWERLYEIFYNSLLSLTIWMFFWHRFTNEMTVKNYYKIFAETPQMNPLKAKVAIV